MKRMLFNATHAEETRVGIVDGQKLIDIDIETVGREARKSNIYKGVVTRIEPSLEACFVNYGEERHGFLPFKEISRAYFKEGVDVRTASIREAITEGQELIVQVEKEERGNKGAALTTFISLAGRYLVLMPNNPRGGGVSRRIEGEERQELREAMEKLDLPSGMSTIARTAGIGRTTEELQWDLNYLLKLWEAISEAAAPQYELMREVNGRRVPAAVTTPVVDGKPLKRLNPPPFLIVEESNLVVRAIRDYFQPDIGELLVDTDEIYEQARQFMAHVMPDMVNRVKRYREDIPLFTRFQIEHQIETAYSRTVPLPSGGAIVIDHTEALVAIDVNSARATRGADIEETAFRTNCEAADEVARQMRLRDLGGLIVIDFIDMADTKNQRAVEQRLKDALRYDRARVQMAKISRFGLMELSRQRLRPALSEGNHITCPRCNGVGVIRDTESCALQVLRILQEEAMKEGTGAVHAQVPVDVATFLLNEKRNDITKLEARHRVPIVLIPNTHLETPHYHIERLRQDDERLEDTTPSFNRAEDVETVADDPYALKSQEDKPQRPKQVPVIKNVIPRDPAPVHVAQDNKDDAGKSAQLQPVTEKKGLFARIAAFLFGESDKKEEEKKPDADKKTGDAKSEDREDRKRRNNRRDGRRVRRTDRTERADKAEKVEKADKSDKTERTEEPRQEDRKRRERPARRPAEAADTQRDDAQQQDAAEKTTRRRTRRRRAAEDEARPNDAAADVQTVTETAVPAAETKAEKSEKAETVEKDEKAERRAPEAPKDVEPAAEDAVRTDDAEASPEGEEADDQQGETRRRRPRRRRRGNRSGADAQTAAEGTETTESAETAETADTAEALPQAAEAKPAAVTEAAPVAEVRTEAVETVVETVVTTDAKAEVKTEEKVAEKVAEKVETPVQAETAAPSDVLVQIETTKPAAPANYVDAKPLGRKPREEAQVEEEPALVQIETKVPERAEAQTEAADTDLKSAAHMADVAQQITESFEKAERRPRRNRRRRSDDTVKTQLRPIAEAVAEIVAETPTNEVVVVARDLHAEQAAKPAQALAEPEVKAEAKTEAQAEVKTEEVAQPKAEAVVDTKAEEPAVMTHRAPVAGGDVAEGLTENLRAAGLEQVHTKPELVTYRGYETVKAPGRVCEARADTAADEVLEQVHTRPELIVPVVYAPVIYPGRPRTVTTRVDEGELIQVHTRTE